MRFSSPEGFHAEERSIVYLLDNLSEGFSHVWLGGKIVDAEVSLSVTENCAFSRAELLG